MLKIQVEVYLRIVQHLTACRETDGVFEVQVNRCGNKQECFAKRGAFFHSITSVNLVESAAWQYAPKNILQ